MLLAVLWLICASHAEVARAAEAALRCGPAFGEMPGPEDFDLERDGTETRLLVSAFDRRTEGEGGLWSVTIGPDGPTQVRRFEVDAGGCPLRPHGVSFARGDDGVARLHVVQHAHAGDDGRDGCVLPRTAGGDLLRHQVLIYRVAGERLELESRLADPLLRSPNDLFALPDGTLYVSNEITDRSLFSALVEYVGLRVGSDVVHYDPRRAGAPWRRVLRGPRFPNGVLALGDRFFVAGTLDLAVHVYRRDPRSGDLVERLGSIWVGSAVDNLMVEDGEPLSLTTAAHPEMGAFLRHRTDPSVPSPWEIWRLRPGGPEPSASRLLRHDGRGVAAAATALRVGDSFYAGQVFGRGLTRCVPESRP